MSYGGQQPAGYGGQQGAPAAPGYGGQQGGGYGGQQPTGPGRRELAREMLRQRAAEQQAQARAQQLAQQQAAARAQQQAAAARAQQQAAARAQQQAAARAAHADVVFLKSRASQKTLRVQSNLSGSVDANGGRGELARWRLVRHGPHISFQSVKTGKFLRIQPDGSLNCLGGNGGALTLFREGKVAGGATTLTSAKGHGNVGALPTGVPKNGKNTGAGLHGQWDIISNDPFPELKNGGSVFIRTVSGKNLRSQNGLVNGNGGNGQFAKWRVYREGTNGVRFQGHDGKYLRVQNDQANASGGTGKLSLFRIHRDPAGTYHFEVTAGAGFLGITPNGQPKAASKTGKGPHGTFTVTRA